MTTRPELFEKWTFVLLTVPLCLLLAFRPIPSTVTSNDTGRYLANFHRYCRSSISDVLFNEKIEHRLFYAVTSPVCLTGSDEVFLFEVAFFLPLMFLFFSSWRKGTFFWACSLLFSVFGLELMTNALGQSFGMLLFFGALALVRKHMVKGLLLGALAVAAHISVLAFFPLLLWFSGVQLSRKALLVGAALLLLFAAAAGLVYQAIFVELFYIIDALVASYIDKYAEVHKITFLLFMTLPLYFVYGARLLFEKKSISVEEHKGIIYATAVLITSFIVFPYVTYRIAIFAIAMQIFLVSISERHGFKIGGFALIGLLAHLFFMLSISDHFKVLFYG